MGHTQRSWDEDSWVGDVTLWRGSGAEDMSTAPIGLAPFASAGAGAGTAALGGAGGAGGRVGTGVLDSSWRESSTLAVNVSRVLCLAARAGMVGSVL